MRISPVLPLETATVRPGVHGIYDANVEETKFRGGYGLAFHGLAVGREKVTCQRVFENLEVILDRTRRHRRVISYRSEIHLLSIRRSGHLQKPRESFNASRQGFGLYLFAQVETYIGAEILKEDVGIDDGWETPSQ